MAGAPVLVTGLPRSGTSWVGKMLQAGGEVVYVNEPLNPSHPPGRSPGVLRADVQHRFQYIAAHNDDVWYPAFRRTVALRFGVLAELRRNRAPYDLARAGKYLASFTAGRLAGRRALLDDPYAFFSTRWFAERLDCRVVVLVRQPESFAGSWQKLGWAVDPRILLEQPELVEDVLGPAAERVRAFDGDRLTGNATLWATAYDVADRLFRDRPNVHLVRYEDLANDPLPAFEALYKTVGLTWSDAAAQEVDAATSAGDGGQAFAWRGASRTAFQPMDSAAAAGAAVARLSPDLAARVRAVTSEVAPRFGY